MVLEPTLSEIDPDADADVTEVPLTVTVALASLTVGVTVIDEVELETDAVYEVVPLAKVGDREPVDSDRADKVASVETAAALVTVIV